jgi:hypothetical protein
MGPVSSNSSATDSSIERLLMESFSVLEAELPPAWQRFCACLDRHSVELRIDDEAFVVRLIRQRPVISAPDADADARIETTRQAILDVLDARLSLRDAVLRDALRVTAPLATVNRLHDGIIAYVHGGVRCPSFPSLLKRLRAAPAHPKEERSLT